MNTIKRAAAIAGATVLLAAPAAVVAQNASAAPATPITHSAPAWLSGLPSWLAYRYQRGTHHRCVIIFNTTPQGDTSTRMCRNGKVELS